MNFEGKYDQFFPTNVAQKLVELIENNAEELAKKWLEDIKKNVNAPTYKKYQDDHELYHRAYRVYSQLGKWISRDTSKEEIKQYWTNLGIQRRKEGFALSEIILAMIMIRRQLWQKVQSEGLLDTAYDLYQAMDLFNRVTVFFDRAIYNAICGYEGKE
jgi:hypothetical protein